eukprot:38084-Amphidinium_carterae.1
MLGGYVAPGQLEGHLSILEGLQVLGELVKTTAPIKALQYVRDVDDLFCTIFLCDHLKRNSHPNTVRTNKNVLVSFADSFSLCA